ncbi:MAG: hypothetical protein QM323_04195 [Acidobacteriota bacterium]|nr:hypothetical protein [Acidobacteriota bacterium]
MQPVGHLCDLLGISRQRPGVFAAMVDLLYSGSGDAREAALDARLDELGRRMTARR